MEVEPAGKDVGAGQALEREVGAVGAAADGLDLGFDAGHLHGFHRFVDDVVVRLHLLPHVVVLVPHFQGGRARAVLHIDEIHHLRHQFFLGLELGAVVVADDVGEVGVFHRTLEGDDVEEALVAFRVFRTLLYGQQTVKLLPDQDGVAHLSLGASRVYVPALDMDFGAGGVEVLELQFPDLPAVHGIGEIGAETLYIEFHHAAADFLVRGEPDLHRAVLEFRMLHHILDRVHNLRHAGFVVCAEEGGSVRRDERLPHIMKHFREFLRLQPQAGNAFEVNGAAVVIGNDLRFHVFTAGIRRGIYMGDEAHGRHRFIDIRGDGGHDIAVFIQVYCYAQGLQFVPQHFQQVPLLGGGGLGFALLIGLGVHCDIAQKSVNYLFHNNKYT